jgi:phage shock protein A
MDRFKKGPASVDKRPASLSPKAPAPKPGPGGGSPSGAVPASSATEEARQRLSRLQDRLSSVQNTLAFTAINNETSEMEAKLALLPPELEALRTRGYVFRSFLERKAGVLAEQWVPVRERVLRESNLRRRELEIEARAASTALHAAATGDTGALARAEGAINTLEAKANAAQSALRALYQPVRDNLNGTVKQVEQIRWLLDQLDEASFRLRPAEDPIAACEAQLLESEKDGPKGVLYLTDERLIFERKEEIATKKVLFITTEKQKVQELVLELPVGQIESTKSSDKGLFGHKELLELVFTPEADLSGARLRLFGADNEEWAALIGRVKSGEIDKERTRPKEEATVEELRSVPTKCPTCGATLSVQVVRGMREITCEYCGSVVRL